MTAPLLTRADLDAMECATPGCGGTTETDAMVIEPQCCLPDTYATWCEYRHGELTLRCARCDRVAAVIAVAG
jgi:hypothetical protein